MEAQHFFDECHKYTIKSREHFIHSHIKREVWKFSVLPSQYFQNSDDISISNGRGNYLIKSSEVFGADFSTKYQVLLC